MNLSFSNTLFGSRKSVLLDTFCSIFICIDQFFLKFSNLHHYNESCPTSTKYGYFQLSNINTITSQSEAFSKLLNSETLLST